MSIEAIIEKATLNQRGETARALKKPKSLKRVLRMAERALERAEAAIEEATEVIPPPRPIACGPGCPYCCHIRLTASAPEILLVLDYIRTTWDEGAKAALSKKVANLGPMTRGKDDAQRAHMRLPCPLLKDGSCSVHPVRPLSCRAVASVDLPACKAAYNSRMAEGVPMYDPQYQIANAVGYGLYAGLVDAGYEVGNLELIAALADGLDNAEIGKKWLKGESAF